MSPISALLHNHAVAMRRGEITPCEAPEMGHFFGCIDWTKPSFDWLKDVLFKFCVLFFFSSPGGSEWGTQKSQLTWPGKTCLMTSWWCAPIHLQRAVNAPHLDLALALFCRAALSPASVRD